MSDADYGYAFEIPAEWYRVEPLTTDCLMFLTDPVALSQPRGCILPNGLMSLSFSIDAWSDSLPVDGPERTAFVQLSGRAVPMWVRYQDEAETGFEGTSNTVIYIQGEADWYNLGFQCRAPSEADDATQATFQAQCDAALSHILDSFQLQSSNVD